MNRRNHFPAFLCLVACVFLPPTVNAAAKSDKAWQVTDLAVVGAPVCDKTTWSYKLAWKPVLHKNRPWKKYKVIGNGCKTRTYTCADKRCTADISGCKVILKGSWASVTADTGKPVPGARVDGIRKPAACK